jgi:hypothetical protein
LILIHNKLFLIVPTVAILATVITLATFNIPTFAQSEGTNETMQNAGESANKTGKSMQQNASDMGSKITEGAKDVVGSIGEKLQDIGK